MDKNSLIDELHLLTGDKEFVEYWVDFIDDCKRNAEGLYLDYIEDKKALHERYFGPNANTKLPQDMTKAIEKVEAPLERLNQHLHYNIKAATLKPLKSGKDPFLVSTLLLQLAEGIKNIDKEIFQHG